jgi:hypothetical protein
MKKEARTSILEHLSCAKVNCFVKFFLNDMHTQ